MSLASLIVEQAGPITTIQAAGRSGRMRYGVPHSGPVDRLAFAAAHQGAGNPAGGALVEMSLGGLTLRCEQGETGFALCGADFSAELDGVQLGPWTAASLRPGSRLRIREGRFGAWAYLAFGGRLRSDTWLGSAATHLLADLGGGRISEGQRLIVDAAPMLPGSRPLLIPATVEPLQRAAIVLGPQDRYFAPEAFEAMGEHPYVASARFDRMGRVLDGPLLVPTGLDMVSEPAVRGSLQVDGEGRLTVLLADHQTTGGYPRIATVAGAHVDRVAQLPPGSKIGFDKVSVEEATILWRDHARTNAIYLDDLAAGRRALGSQLLATNLIDGVFDARNG